MPRKQLNPQEYIGIKYNKLLVLEFVGRKPKISGLFFRCKCDCGNESIVKLRKLQVGDTKACGCLRGKKSKGGKGRKGKRTEVDKRLYSIWKNMRYRCNNPKHKSYLKYGGRGIGVCSEWENDFKIFRIWALENGYDSDLSLDRRNNDLGYSPSNCRWITFEAQQNNKSNNVFIIYKGEKKVYKRMEPINWNKS